MIMAAPKNNQFWKLRAKNGRDKIFESPKEMLEACYEYFEHQSKQIWNKIDFKGKEAERVEIPTASPFTLTGLCIYLGVNTKYFTEFEKNCSKDFSEVITHIRDIIYNQKFEGAAVGAYNANIIARDLGLKDSSDITTGGKPINNSVDLSKLTDKELKELEKLTSKLSDKG